MPLNPNATALDGTPSPVTIATTELTPVIFDFAANVVVGETLATPSSLLTDLSNGGLLVTLTDTPTVGASPNQTKVTQEIRGAELIAGHIYRLIVTADFTGQVSGKRLSISVLINVPY